MPKHGKARLNLDRYYRAASRAEQALPRMVKKLIERFESDKDLSAKEQVIILRALASLSKGAERVLDDLGLTKQNQQTSNNPLILLLADRVQMANFKRMSANERDALLLDVLRGKAGSGVHASNPPALPPPASPNPTEHEDAPPIIDVVPAPVVEAAGSGPNIMERA